MADDLGLDKSMDFIDNMADGGETALRQTVIEAVKTDPDRAARALGYSNQHQIPLDMAERNLDTFENDEKWDKIDFTKIQYQYPLVADFLRDKENAMLAHDDIDGLTFVADRARGLGATALGVIGRPVYAVGEGLQSVSREAEKRFTPSDNPVDNFLFATTIGTIDAAGDVLSLSGESTLKAQKMVDVPDERRGWYDDVISGVGQVGAQVAAAYATGGASLAPLFFADMAGYGYEKAKEEGQEDTARADMTALAYGSIAAITEKYGLQAIMKGIPANVKRGASEAIGDALVKVGLKADGLTSDALIKFTDTLYRMATEGTQEAIEGVGQNIVDQKVLGTNKDVGFVDNALEGAGYQAGIGATVGGLFGAAMNLMVKGKTSFEIEAENYRAEEVRGMREALNGSDKNIGSKLFRRSKDKMNDLLKRHTEEKDYYLNPEAVMTLYQSMPEDGRALLNQQIPDFEARLNDAIKTNDDFVIERADYHTYVQPLDEKTILDDYIRFEPEQLSVGDRARQEEDYKEFISALTEGADMEGKDVEQASVVQQYIYGQLVKKAQERGASTNAEVAKTISQNVAKAYSVLARRKNLDPRYMAIFNNYLRDLGINRVDRRVLEIAKRDDFDLYIDKIRNSYKALARSRAAQDKKNQDKKDAAASVGKTAKIFGRGKKKDTPLIKFFIKQGGVQKDSPIAAELRAMGVTPKTYPALFKNGKNDGIIREFDDFGVRDLEEYLGVDGIFSRDEEYNGYAPQQEILDLIREETFGNAVLPQEQQDEQRLEEELIDILSNAGLNIETATNQEVRYALDQYQKESMESMYGSDPAQEMADVFGMGERGATTYYQDENGNPKSTDSQAFKDWFGDSKVVDADGRPLVVYHGTSANNSLGFVSDFEKFKLFSHFGSKQAANDRLDPSIYPKELKNPRVLPVYLSIKNPVRIEDSAVSHTAEELAVILENMEILTNKEVDEILSAGSETQQEIALAEKMNSAGYDGFIYENLVEGVGSESWIAVNPSQIKSVFNRGTFDPNDPRILYQSANGLRSELVTAVSNLKQEKGTGEQMLGILKNTQGVKEEEIAWTGLDEFLKGKKSVTKQEIAEYLDANQVQIEEVTLGEDTSEVEAWWNDEGGANEETPFSDLTAKEQQDAIARYRDEVGDYSESGTNTKFSKYTLAGGENYREVLLTLPPERKALEQWRLYDANGVSRGTFMSEETAKIQAERKGEGHYYERIEDQMVDTGFKSSHYDKANILAHVRLNDRVDADGKKVLFVEEIQSDWHQAGRKKGYDKGPLKPDQIEVKWNDPVVPEGHNPKNYMGYWESFNKETKEFIGRHTGRFSEKEAIEDAASISGMKTNKVPDAPFKKSWHEMAFRRVTQMAAQQGYDRVAWTTGEQQNERYDLSKSVSQITYSKANNTLYAADIDGGQAINETNVTPDKLEDYVGKDIAKKLMDQDPVVYTVRENEDGTAHVLKPDGKVDGVSRDKAEAERIIKKINDRKEVTLSGIDLKVGGSGMKGFYDNILVKYADKFGKKFGVKVGQTDLLIDDPEAADFSVQLPNGKIVHTTNMKANADAVAKQFKDAVVVEYVPEKTPVHSMDITPEMREAARAGFSLFQEGRQGPRGQISFFPDKSVTITLFENENLSTVMHELGHLYYKVLTEVALLDQELGGEPTQIMKDVVTLRRWAGADDNLAGVLTIEQEEKIADGFLDYIRAGVAPSVELQDAFGRMKFWISRIYKGIRDTLPKISPEVKEVFDRILATDEEISRISQKPEFAIDQAIYNFLPKGEAEKYKKKITKSLESAKADLLKKSLHEAERKYSKAYKEALIEAKKQATEQVNNEQIYRTADEIIKAGGLDYTTLQREFGKEVFAYLTVHGKGMVGPKKERMVRPADMAALMGFGPAGSRDMIGAFMNAPKKMDRIRMVTEEIMAEKYGDMLNDGRIEEEAMRSYHNAVREEVLAIEYKILKDMAGIAGPTPEFIKAKAAQTLSDKAVQDIRPDRYLRSEGSSYFKYGKALGQKNYAVAAKHKAQQLYNHHLYRGAIEADAKITRKLEYFRKLVTRKDSEIAKKRTVTRKDENDKEYKVTVQDDIDFVYAARAILAKYGIGKETFNFDSWLSQLTKENPDMADALQMAIAMNTESVPAWTQSINKRGAVTRTPPYKRMAYGDFLALGDAVSNLIETGRGQRELTIAGQKIELAKVVEKINDVLLRKRPAKISSGYGAKMQDRDIANILFYSAKAHLRRVNAWATAIDGGYNGPVAKYIVRPILDGIGKYRDARRAELQKIKAIVLPYKDFLYEGGPIVAPELISEKTGEYYTFENLGEVVGMLVHIGNPSNKKKLIRGMGWGEVDADGNVDSAALDQFRKRLELEGVLKKEHYDMIQAMWDQMNDLKPAVWKAHKEIYGFRPDEITFEPFDTTFGTYRGGYWPAIVDKKKNADAAKREAESQLANENNQYAFPSTGRGALKSRVENYSAPLEFELKTLVSHVDWALRFIHIQPTIMDAMKIIRDKDFCSALNAIDPSAIDEMLVPWLSRVARQATSLPSSGEGKAWVGLNRVAGYLRRQTGLVLMAGNVINILQQPTTIANSVRKVGGRRLGKAFLTYMKSPRKGTELINEMSVVMRNQHNIFASELESQTNRIFQKRNTLQKIGDWAEDHGYIGQIYLQHYMNNLTWTAAFQQALDGDVKGINLDDKQAAIEYADSVVAETQGFGSPEYMSKSEVRTEMGKLFLMFYGYFNNQGNMMATDASLIQQSDKTGMGKAASAFYLYFTGLFIGAVVADLIGAAMRGNLPDDDDEDGTVVDDYFQFILLSHVKYGAAMLPYARDVLNTVIGKFTDVPFDDRISPSPVFSVWGSVINAPFDLYNAMFDDGDASKAVKSTLTAVGLTTRLPAGFVVRPATYVADVMEGDSEIPDEQPAAGLEVGRGLLSGPAVGGN